MNNNDHAQCALGIIKSFIHRGPIGDRDVALLQLIDSSEFYSYMVKQKLVPLSFKVFGEIQAEIPTDIYTQSKRLAKRISMRNLMMYRESQIIQKYFSEQGVCIIPYKGVHFTKIFYNDLSLRPSVDIDYAISLKGLEESFHIMKQLGYQEVKGTLNFDNIKRSRAFYLDYPWEKKMSNGQKIFVEFHLAPAHKALFVPLDFSTYLNPLETLDSQEDRLFSKVDHALFVLIHHGAVDIWGSLMQLVDLNQILATLTSEELDQLLILAEKSKVRRLLDLGLILLERLFDKYYAIQKSAPIPDSLIRHIEQDCTNASLSGKWSENRVKIKFHLRMRDSRLDQIRSLVSLGRYALFEKWGI